MASVTYGKSIMANVNVAKLFMAKILWQMKLSPMYYNKSLYSYFDDEKKTIQTDFLKKKPESIKLTISNLWEDKKSNFGKNVIRFELCILNLCKLIQFLRVSG